MEPQIRKLGTTGDSKSVSLPRKMLDLLGWEKGDYISLLLDEEEKTLTLKKVNL